jgi:hypothetical protein
VKLVGLGAASAVVGFVAAIIWLERMQNRAMKELGWKS